MPNYCVWYCVWFNANNKKEKWFFYFDFDHSPTSSVNFVFYLFHAKTSNKTCSKNNLAKSVKSQNNTTFIICSEAEIMSNVIVNIVIFIIKSEICCGSITLLIRIFNVLLIKFYGHTQKKNYYLLIIWWRCHIIMS